MKLGIILTQGDPETVFNALRLALHGLGQGDQSRVFLLGRGVEMEDVEDERFDVKGQAQRFLDGGGEILACGTCLKIRKSAGSELCPLSTLQDLYELVRDSDRVVAF